MANVRNIIALIAAHRQGEFEWAPPAVNLNKNPVTKQVMVSTKTPNKKPTKRIIVTFRMFVINTSMT